MSEVFYLRPIDPPLSVTDVRAMAQQAVGCFALHRVAWKQSFLSADGARMLCWYSAPDAESARMALRELGSDMNAVWTARVLGEHAAAPALSSAALVAEIVLDAPLAGDEVERRIAAAAGRVALVRAFASSRGTQLVCLLAAGDARAAEAALEAASLPPQSIWACAPVTPQGS